jgi:hypothetical protein
VKPCYFVEITKVGNSHAINQFGVKESLIVWIAADEFWFETSFLTWRVAGF